MQIKILIKNKTNNFRPKAKHPALRERVDVLVGFYSTL
jgi:hypothetical protein